MPSADSLPRLFVDGYNMIGAWPTLVKLREQHGFEAARQELIEILTNYSARKGLDTQLVFDAYAVRSPHQHLVITSNLSVCYTAFGQTADSYIEYFCAQLWQRALPKSRVIVATSDYSHRLTVVGYGAEWISAQQLHSDITFTHSQVNTAPRRTSRSLFDRVNSETREKLMRLRLGP
jgi:predicted RNA-binding protein with PIN domain